MRRIMVGRLGGLLALGIGTAAWATGTDNGKEPFNFGQMLPFMQEMHPDLTKDELREMYNNCHGTNGAAPSKNFEIPMNNMMGL